MNKNWNQKEKMLRKLKKKCKVNKNKIIVFHIVFLIINAQLLEEANLLAMMTHMVFLQVIHLQNMKDMALVLVKLIKFNYLIHLKNPFLFE